MPTVSSAPAEEARAPESRVRRRVLLVDDQPDFLDLARDALNAHPGLSVVGEARTGREALDLLRALDPEILVLDVRLPDIDGLETARRALEVSPTLRVIMVSAYDEPGYHDLAISVGALAYVPKRRLWAESLGWAGE